MHLSTKTNLTIFSTKLFLIIIFLIFSFFPSETSASCAQRCSRLLDRSLKQINFSVKKVENLFISTNLMTDFGKICWKFYDFADCEKQCEKKDFQNSDISAREEQIKKLVLKRCKFMDKEYSHDIKCIHKYHSFMEIRCSSYLNEAVKLRKNIKENKKAKIQETCRFLHYHNTCLSNTVFFYCPTAKKFFNRFTLRDYFLSFIIPDDDQAFSDEFLDYCQIFDFHKIAKDVYDTTSSIKSEEYDISGENRQNQRRTTTTTTAIPVVKLLDDSNSSSGGDEKDKDIIDEKGKKVFSSQEDLKENPPEFFYSSARYETTTYQSIKDKSNKSYSKSNPTSSDSDDWSPKPVNIDFVSNPIFDEPKPTDSSSVFTINPNQLLSTIFRIPNVFPTVEITPDQITQTANFEFGTSVELLPSKNNDDEYYDDNETTWITKNVISPKNVTQTPQNQNNKITKEPAKKMKTLETNKTKPKVMEETTTTIKSVVITTTTAADKSLKPLKKVKGSGEKIVEILGGKNYDSSNSSSSSSAEHLIVYTAVNSNETSSSFSETKDIQINLVNDLSKKLESQKINFALKPAASPNSTTEKFDFGKSVELLPDSSGSDEIDLLIPKKPTENLKTPFSINPNSSEINSTLDTNVKLLPSQDFSSSIDDDSDETAATRIELLSPSSPKEIRLPSFLMTKPTNQSKDISSSPVLVDFKKQPPPPLQIQSVTTLKPQKSLNSTENLNIGKSVALLPPSKDSSTDDSDEASLELLPSKEIIELKVPENSKESSSNQNSKISSTTQPKLNSGTTVVNPIGEQRRQKPQKPFHRKISSKENAKPYLSGTKIHVIPIRQYSKEDEMEGGAPKIITNSGETSEVLNSEEKRNDLVKTHEDQINPILPQPDSSPNFIPPNSDSDSDESNFPKTNAAAVENEKNIVKSNNEIIEDEETIELFNFFSSLKWIIIGYFLLFITALGVIVYLLISIITKKCKQRRKKYYVSE